MSNIKSFKNKVPVTTERITAVTKYDNAGLLIRDYVKGLPINDGVCVNINNSNTAILTYPFSKNDIYVEKSIEGKFRYMCGKLVELQADSKIVGEALKLLYDTYTGGFE